MATEAGTYDLSELSEAAGVTPRTVRYYVQQGLLPAPSTRGPGTRYDRPYLDRLQLIRRLQREHLPLAEIRRRLEALGDDGIREALGASPEPPSESSALDYVRELLARHALRTVDEAPISPAHSVRAVAGSPPPTTTPPAEPGLRRRSEGMLGAFTQALVARHLAEPTSPAQSARSTRSTWERIPLAPDVELHVRRPLSREQNRQVERLLEAARDLFAEEP